MNAALNPVVRDILRDYLITAPLKGAKLKPLLAREFERRTGQSFFSIQPSFQKFTDFLRAYADTVEVTLPEGPGDISVRLRVDAASASSTASISEGWKPQATSRVKVSTPIWLAFTNPDTKRKRFVHRDSLHVVHFNDAEFAEYGANVQGNPSYVEIPGIAGTEQSAWMREFIDTLSVAEGERATLRSLAAIPYSSSVNRAFGGALKGNMEAWMAFRTNKIEERIRHWAEAHSMEHAIGRAKEAAADKMSPAGMPAPAASALPAADETRRQLHRAVDALDTAELAQVLIPATVLAKLAGSKST